MRIAVAMSGGVDSTAVALLLRKAGHEVVGFHMRLHDGSHVTWDHARDAARAVGVPIHQVDLRRAFSETVIAPFVEAYTRGRTPSPCPVCNREIKTALLFRAAEAHGCEKLATGHYARVAETEDGPGLFRGADTRKDQSYFLFMLTRTALARTVFPLGTRTKDSVRELLKEEGIPVWQSEESQELCFLTSGDYRDFLRERGVASSPGPIKDLSGVVVGTHGGITQYTVGQRRGLGICGPQPHYVVRIDAPSNTVLVGTKEQTLVSRLRIRQVNLLAGSGPEPGERFQVKIRSRAKMVWCRVFRIGSDHIDLAFDEPQSAVAPGQAAVLYKGDRVMGGGWIDTRHD